MSDEDRPRFRSRIGAAADRLRRFAFGELPVGESARQAERLGQTDHPRPPGTLLWMLTNTSAEAGPAPALAREISARLEAPVNILVTPMSEVPLAPAVEAAVIHQFAPTDTEGTARRFLDHWQPDFVLVVGHPERERVLSAAAERAIPLLWAAPKRERDQTGRRLPGYMKLFNRCFAASASEAEAMESALRTGKTQIEITGPLLDTAHALPCNEQECHDLGELLGGRPVWLAAEVGGQELDIVEAAHRKAFRSAHRLLLIIVPRKDEDADKLSARLEKQGWQVSQRSTMAEPDPEVQIYVADTEGELGLWYRLAPASFIGGTLAHDLEPTDPFAPATLGSAVLHGPQFGRSASRFASLETHSASLLVRNAEELGDAVITLLAPDKAASLAQAGWATTTESAHVVERIAEVIQEITDERDGVN